MMRHERTCTAHTNEPYEAETFEQMGLTYLLLRCPVCHRPSGQRLVRRKVSS